MLLDILDIFLWVVLIAVFVGWIALVLFILWIGYELFAAPPIRSYLARPLWKDVRAKEETIGVALTSAKKGEMVTVGIDFGFDRFKIDPKSLYEDPRPFDPWPGREYPPSIMFGRSWAEDFGVDLSKFKITKKTKLYDWATMPELGLADAPA